MPSSGPQSRYAPLSSYPSSYEVHFQPDLESCCHRQYLSAVFVRGHGSDYPNVTEVANNQKGTMVTNGATARSDHSAR